MQEWRRMQNELGNLAKTCRNLQLKLKRTKRRRSLNSRRGRLSTKPDMLSPSTASVSAPTTLKRPEKKKDKLEKETVDNNDDEDEEGGAGSMLKSAAIWATVLVAGYQIMSRLKSGDVS